MRASTAARSVLSVRTARTVRPVSALLAVAVVMLGAVGATGCSGERGDRPDVVVTTNILGDVVRTVLGGEADVAVLMQPNANPHSFGVSAAQAAEIESADLVVHNGLGLEENVTRHVDAAREAGVATLAVAEHVDPIAYTSAHTSNDSEGQADPHFWTDPDRMRRAVDVIAATAADTVEGIDPDRVEENAAAYGRRVAELSSWMDRRFGAIPAADRQLVTDHHVFGYLARRFGFRVVGAVIPSGTTLASPSASDLESLARAVETAGVRAVFTDSAQPDRLSRVLRSEADVDVEVVPLFTESLTERGGGAADYLQMMRANTEAIADGLTG